MRSEEGETTGARVLIVDDVEVNRDLLARRLQRLGHTIGMAENGQQALDLARSESWDLIMLDVMMPVLDGIGALSALKADVATRDVPVIMISANTEIESVVRCIELGAEDYLPKPFDPVLLRARVGATLEKKRLRDRERARSLLMQKDLEVGARIQRDFLPDTLPVVEGYEMSARFEPAREVGGDFYDAFLLPSSEAVFVLGDVCDKGVGAALFMALFRSLIRAAAMSGRTTVDAESHAELVLRVVTFTNDYIARTHGRANMFATLFVGILDQRSGTITYVNGGHESPRIVSASGGVRTLLGPTGPAVGMLPDMPFTTGMCQLTAGETLLVLTDGVTESRARSGELLGDQATDTLLAIPDQSADALLERLMDAVHAHATGAAASDDITLFALKRTSPTS